MKRLRIFIVCAITCLPGLSHAAPETNMVYGAGLISCGTLIKSVDSGDQDKSINLMAISWVQGYVSAMSQVIEPMEKTNMFAMTEYLDKYCRENPTETIQVASDILVGQLWAENPNRKTP